MRFVLRQFTVSLIFAGIAMKVCQLYETFYQLRELRYEGLIYNLEYQQPQSGALGLYP